MNRKAVITGATKGIGRAIAEALATEGYDIAVCSRTEADLEAMRVDFQDRFPHVKFLSQVVDMRQKADVENFAQTIVNQWNRVDVVVNNAGIYVGGSIQNEAEGALEQMIETNLYSAYYLTRALLPTMLERKKGYIFNMCSIASTAAYPNGGSYSISKFALLGFSKNLREELKDKGIRVCAILPGGTWSESWAGFEAPVERLMQARDVAETIVAALRMSASAVVEEIVMRPQLGDL
jgi:NADP-dependent 3-hydroxy acid dehydrogenase YdfG